MKRCFAVPGNAVQGFRSDMSHNHHHIDPEAGDRKVVAAIAANAVLTLAQIVGGILSGSLALIADAVHNFSDTISLAIAFAARRIARRPRDASMTLGYGRIEIVAALMNYTALIVIGLFLLYEAAMRLIEPEPVAGWIVVVVAGVALFVDLLTAMLTYRMSKESVNIRAAFLHNVADALGSVAVIVAGTLILVFGWWLVDPIVTAMIAGYILWQSLREIGPVIRILMLGSPPGIETEAVLAAMAAETGVADIHHVHFWQFDEHRSALDAHVAVLPGYWGEADTIKSALKSMLTDRFDIARVTLEIECSRHVCKDASRFGQDRSHPH